MAAGPYTSETQWASCSEHVTLERLDDICLAFHKLSGDTHILNFLTEAILIELRSRPATFSDLESRLCSALELAPEDIPAELVQKTVLDMDDAGLVQPVIAT